MGFMIMRKIWNYHSMHLQKSSTYNMDTFKKALIEAGITNQFLLNKTQEFILAIKDGTYKPKNKKKELKKLIKMKEDLIFRIKNKIE